MEAVSRYVEFHEANLEVFSIELAHLLFAAASEVDVVAKLLCEQVAPAEPHTNINDYKAALLPAHPDLVEEEVFVPRYGLEFRPWSNWGGANNPDWWRSYNHVKHERAVYFYEATLKNALNALGALLILTYHYYARALATPPALQLSPKDTMQELEPQSVLLRLKEDYYRGHLLLE